ncbi:MAG: hypothetical protein ACK4GG_11130 [Sphingomonas sp.]
MSRVEISGYLQIVVGVVGIIVTVLTAPAMLDAVGGLASGQAMPQEFRSVSGFIRVFCVLFVLVALLMMILIGMSITLGTLFKALNANHPTTAATLLVLAILASTISVTLAVFATYFWVPGVIASVGLTVMFLTACLDEKELSNTALAGVVTLFMFFGAGFVVLLATVVGDQDLHGANQITEEILANNG